MWVKSYLLYDFLGENGLFPYWEGDGLYYYKPSKRLDDLLLRYEIIHTLIPNKGVK
jgi:hypothetical protein